jgi:hypothetical protein
MRLPALALVAIFALLVTAGCTSSATVAPPASVSGAAPSTPAAVITSGHGHAPTTGHASTTVHALDGTHALAPNGSGSTPELNGEAGHAIIPTCAHPAPGWDQVTQRFQGDAQGYASADSALPGTDIGLYISTLARRYRVEAYRMGYYGPKVQACQVWTSAWLNGRVQASAVVIGGVNEATAPWALSLTVHTTGWSPGDYLFRIDGGTPMLRRFIPLTLRSPSFAGRVVLVMPDTTWQAYNTWGGHNLYYGPHHSVPNRARIVSFDRPYGWGLGAGDFIANELPLLSLTEKLGLQVGYATDVDLERDHDGFLQARMVVSAGHDEYYSPGMRETLTDARDHGVNLAFFGANDIYRKIRFADTAIGPDRAVINYKDDTDPIGIPNLVTTQWRDPPSSDPESSLVGADYRCATPAPPALVVADAGAWLFAGSGVTNGMTLPHAVGLEFDGITTNRPIPRPLTVLFHSQGTCNNKRAVTQDSTYYTAPSGAGVLDISALNWNCALADSCVVPMDARTTAVITRVTSTVLLAGAAGPLGRTHKAVDNVRSFYPMARPAPR